MERTRHMILLSALLGAGRLLATEYVVPVANVAGFFAKLPKDATYVSFSAAAVYKCNTDIVLPETPLLVIDGKGSRLILGPNSNGFTCAVADQKGAMRRTASRYTIRDFAAIEGGRRAIDLKATLGSTVANCRFTGQTEAAVDLRFCLMARVQNVLVTNPVRKGIVVRCGDWPGATATNSQSNSTVLEQCRVYCAATTTEAYTVLNSGGVRMTDCISEGAAADHDLFLSAAMDGNENRPATNPVVKSFTMANFHVEHKVRKASIHINMPVKASVDLSNVYWNGPQTAPVIRYLGGQLNLHNIGWWNPEFRIHTRVNAPRINIDACHSALVTGEKVGANGTKAGALELVDPLPGNTRLSLEYVRVTRRSM
ncbi:MAG: hypothetical protein ABI432_03470 [Flavobacteriales bacterium]